MDCSNTLPRSGARDGDDFDTITAWRRLLKYTQRAGVTSSAKRRMRRRERHEAKRNLLDEYSECLGYEEEDEVANSLKQIFEDYRLGQREEPRANLQQHR